jgi:hypothetical protein
MPWKDKTGCCVVAILAALSACRFDVPARERRHPPGADHPIPRREEYGGLTVLHLYGSYREMGTQAVELLGDTARRAEHLYYTRWQGLVQRLGPSGVVADLLWPNFWSWAGRYYEESGFFRELDGVAAGLSIPPADAVRSFYGGIFGGGSTAFVATRRASGGLGAVLGRNVDWSDDEGIRRPVVAYYHPTNGDLSFISVGWALSQLAIVGLNEAGLAVSLNFFEADQQVGRGLPQMMYRRVLQRARDVEEANAMLLGRGNRAGAALVLLADAQGRMAVWECLPSQCARYEPGRDWVGLSNHARTEVMVPHDRGRTPDSVRRLAAIEAAVQRHMGAIDPEVAATIMRDRSNSAYANDSTVANFRVLNSVVVQPGTGTLWHATSVQPEAPFGEMVPFSLGGPVQAGPLAADGRFAGGSLEPERRVVEEMREAAALLASGRIVEACAIWDRIGEAAEGFVEPHRLLWARARARWMLERWDEAEALLDRLQDAAAPIDVTAYGLVALGMVRDRLERRADALSTYGRAKAYLREHGEYVQAHLFAPLDPWIDDGLRTAQRGPIPAMPDLQLIPR